MDSSPAGFLSKKIAGRFGKRLHAEAALRLEDGPWKIADGLNVSRPYGLALAMLEGDSSDLWRECGVFDFSTLGVGMDFRHPGSSDLVGRRISVRLPGRRLRST